MLDHEPKGGKWRETNEISAKLCVEEVFLQMHAGMLSAGHVFVRVWREKSCLGLGMGGFFGWDRFSLMIQIH